MSVGFAFVFERVEELVDEHDMEFVGVGRTQTGLACRGFLLDERPGDVERVQEVLDPLRAFFTRPSEWRVGFGDRSPFVEERGERVERARRKPSIGA